MEFVVHIAHVQLHTQYIDRLAFQHCLQNADWIAFVG